MHNKQWFYPLWALVAFWAWALHVATGFLDNLIAASSGKRSGIVGMLNSFTEGVLIGPIGRPLTVILLVMAGLGSMFWMYKKQGEAEETHDDAEPTQDKAKHSPKLKFSLEHREVARRSANVKRTEPVLVVEGWSAYMAAANEMTSERKAWLNEVLAVDSDVLRAYFLSRMEDEDTSGIYGRNDVTDEEYQKHREAMLAIVQRNAAAFEAAFGEDPLPLTMDLYTRLPARSGLPTPTAALRHLTAGFDAALDYGWMLSLIAQNPSLKSYNTTRYDWKQSVITQNALRMSDAQLSHAMQTVGKLIAAGASDARYKFENWYYYVVRAAVADNWPKHRDELIAVFSAGFTGRPQDHSNVLRLTEILLEETLLTREDIPELVEFDRISAKLDDVRASVFAELGEPLASAMEEVLDSGGGLLDTKRYPALRSLRKLSPERRGECFVQLVSTISGLHRHGLDHWEKLKREKGRYRLGLDHDPGYSVQPEMSFLFSELTRKEIVLPDRDETISAFMDLLPFLIYLQDQETLDLVLETAKQVPKGLTAKKLRAPLPKPKHHPFLPQFSAAIDDTMRSLSTSARS